MRKRETADEDNFTVLCDFMHRSDCCSIFLFIYEITHYLPCGFFTINLLQHTFNLHLISSPTNVFEYYLHTDESKKEDAFQSIILIVSVVFVDCPENCYSIKK